MSFKSQWYQNKLSRKHSKGFRGYPVATVAFYGPNDMHASKVAVGIILKEGSNAELLERWFSKNVDVISDLGITRAILRFIERHAVKSVVVGDRIIGCPHEEGIDYPDGEKCPQCKFWAIRDRWSGDLIH